MGQSKLGWTCMKQTRLKVLKHKGKMPIYLSPEICRLSFFLFVQSIHTEVKKGKNMP